MEFLAQLNLHKLQLKYHKNKQTSLSWSLVGSARRKTNMKPAILGFMRATETFFFKADTKQKCEES